jgi:hypothetical protein
MSDDLRLPAERVLPGSRLPARKEHLMVEIHRQEKRGPLFRRPLIRGAVAVAAVAVIALAVLSIVDVFGPDGPSIVEKAIAALDPGKDAIIHVKISGAESGAAGYKASWTDESWTRTESPYTRRDILAFAGAPVMEIVQDSDGRMESYDTMTNTIHRPPQAEGFEAVPAQPDPYRAMILELLNSGGAVVDGSDSLDGKAVTRIASSIDYGSAADGTRYGTWYYIEPDTKNPVEWRMTRADRVVTIHFDVYEQLPASEDNLKFLDLASQYPGAASDTSLQSFEYSGGWPSPEVGGDPVDKK